MRDLVYYVAVSVDGFIAAPDGTTDAFPVDPQTLAALFGRYPETCPAHVRAALGVTEPPARFDAVIMGAATHRVAMDAGLTSAYPHLKQYVVSHHDLPPDPTVSRVEGDLAMWVRQLKALDGADIWLCGGADLAGQLLEEIDEVQVKVNPVVLGRGVPLTRASYAVRNLRVVRSEVLPGGVVLTTYRRPE